MGFADGDSEDFEEEGADEDECPLCGDQNGSCEHLLANVDTTFSQIGGGRSSAGRSRPLKR
jgi:hypothetical protein